MNTEHTYFEWSEDYSIGVKVIDDAHRQLFSIVSRIIRNFVDNDFVRNKMICIEAVKYLKVTSKNPPLCQNLPLQIGYNP